MSCRHQDNISYYLSDFPAFWSLEIVASHSHMEMPYFCVTYINRGLVEQRKTCFERISWLESSWASQLKPGRAKDRQISLVQWQLRSHKLEANRSVALRTGELEGLDIIRFVVGSQLDPEKEVVLNPTHPQLASCMAAKSPHFKW